MRRFWVFAFVCAGFLVMWLFQRPVAGPRPPAAVVAPLPAATGQTVLRYPFDDMPAADLIIAGQALEQRWSADLKKGTVYSGDEAELKRIRYALTMAKMSPSDRKAANEILAAMHNKLLAEVRIRQKQEHDALEANFVPRVNFAHTIEENFLKRGYDVVMKTSGDKHQTLTMRYILLGRPFVYKIVNESDFLQKCGKLGFKLIVFTDGYDHTWRYDVAKGAFR